MKVIAYLAFTLLSVVVQFCVVDLTQEKKNTDLVKVKLNATGRKERFEDLLKTFTEKPHALYYRTQENAKLKESNVKLSTKANENVSVQGMDTSTVFTSTVIEEMYDESLSTTEDAFSTESIPTSTEFDNVTEISFFDKNNKSAEKPAMPKKRVNKDCSCNLLYQVCDINCCCDSDCSDSQLKLFVNCKNGTRKTEQGPYLCYPYQHYSRDQNNIIDNLFCIVKTNLPAKRNLNPKKYDITTINRAHKWKSLKQPQNTEFEKKQYVFGDPVWVLKDGSIWYIDIPSQGVNNYCSGRKPILFLDNTNVMCTVSLKDLELFRVLKTSNEAPCISVTELSLNTTTLNCSTLHCTNWSIIACDELKCVDYNRSIHEPSCTDTHCSNLALKIEYIFQYYNSKIMNATLKLHIQKLSTHTQYFNQEISVKFILSNESLDKVTEISGNPGYIHGRPVITSAVENNRTLHFFNMTSNTKKRYIYNLSNKNGICVVASSEPDLILFGLNKRLKCRFVHNGRANTENSSNTCNQIETSIEKILGLNEKIYVSPYGNPLDVKDNAWIPVQHNLFEKDVTYGRYVAKNSKLRCYNIVTRISYIFTFADVSERGSKRVNKIISANVSVTTQNVTFNSEDISLVLTTDINFIDGTKQRMYEYAAGPHINLHLPSDFFFPFRSNGSHMNDNYRIVNLMVLLCYVYWQIK